MERIDFTLTLVAETPLHVGGAGPDRLSDLPLATDGQDRLLVPGSSWAGVLRALAVRLSVDAAELFGPAPGDDGKASRLTVGDTAVARDVGIELRTGVGIDRRLGAAAHRIVHDRLLLPVGTRLQLDLRYDGPDGADARILVAAVRARGIRIGAATSRGLGRLRCTKATARTIDLDSRASLLAALSGAGQPKSVDPAAADLPADPAFVVSWRPVRPVVVGGPSPGETADLVPLLVRTADGMVPVLPGSSVKGLLRALAERVVRTVLDLPDPDPGFVTAQARLVDLVPSLELLFGSTERAGALSVPDTTAAVPAIRVADWRDYLATGTPAPSGWSHERTHVAIDRWTGGAADQRLFGVQETTIEDWHAIRLDLDGTRLSRAAPRDRAAAVVLLGIAVALLREGEAGLGHGSTRGLGEVEVTSVEVTGLDGFGLAGPGDDWWGWLFELADGNDLEGLIRGDAAVA